MALQVDKLSVVVENKEEVERTVSDGNDIGETDVHPDLPKNYFSYLIKAMRYFGIELYHESESKLYKIYSRTVLFVGLYFYVSVAFVETFLHKDFDTISQIWSYLFSHILGVLKISVLIVNRKQISKLMKEIQRGAFAPSKSRGQGWSEYRFVAETLAKTKFQNVLYCTILLCIVLEGVYTSLNAYLWKPQNMWHFAFVPFTIFDCSKSPLFEIMWIYQTVLITNMSFFIAHTDILIVTLIAHVGTQFKILQNSIINVKNRAEHNIKDNELEAAIKQCLGNDIDHHLAIIRIRENLEYLCSYLVLCVFIADSFVLCFLLYFSSKFPIGSTIFIQHVIYYILVAYQLWMYCSWGNVVTAEGEKVAWAAYDCPWLDRPTYFRKATILIIQRSHRPVLITAGKFFPLSYETWLSVLRASVSYFMFLKTMNET